MPELEQVFTRIPATPYRKLKRWAKAEGRSVANLVRQIILDAIAAHEAARKEESC